MRFPVGRAQIQIKVFCINFAARGDVKLFVHSHAVAFCLPNDGFLLPIVEQIASIGMEQS